MSGHLPLSGPPGLDRPSGGLDHLIEKLRLSDRPQPHFETDPVEHRSFNNPAHPSDQGRQAGNQHYQHPQHNVYPQQSRQIPGQRLPPQSLPQQQQQRSYQSPSYARQSPAFHQQGPAQNSPRGLSLMDYVKSPGNRNSASPSQPGNLAPRQFQQQHQHQNRQQPQQHYHSNRNHHNQQFSNQGPNHYRQYSHGPKTQRQHFDPAAQIEYLDTLALKEIPKVAMEADEVDQKQRFRIHLVSICQKALDDEYPGCGPFLNLIPYGSMLSGFAVKGSDMDIICSITGPLPELEPEIIPRLLELALLKNGIGARALTRTRVPILKVCEKPTEALHSALLEDHEKWRFEKDNPKPEVDDKEDPPESLEDERKEDASKSEVTSQMSPRKQRTPRQKEAVPGAESNENETDRIQDKPDPKQKEWRREKTMGPLDFPKSGIGFQCDISFRGLLGVHNTQLLRCYSACDPRVRSMILFVKSWAKQRQVNSSYSGTLCSYGWVIMVLHFLINIARPPVLPNLQIAFGAAEKQPHIVDGYNVSFADDERQLAELAAQHKITSNTESLGSLLRNFYHYYAHQGPRVIAGGFRWKDDVISIRSQGGLVSKASKGWTGASNIMVKGVEVRQRYLLAVECPIETDHNVARTVHHFGVVAVRDELRRAWSLLEGVGMGLEVKVGLFDGVEDQNQNMVKSEKDGQQQVDQRAR